MPTSFLQELYNPVPSKREPKLEATGPCKRETVLQGEVLDILDSEEEQEAAAPIVKRPKAECHSPVRAHATSAGEALVVLTDDEHDEIMGSNDSNVSPVPLQAAAAEPHHKPTAPVLKVRDHWRELLLSGAKTWELRTFSCEADRVGLCRARGWFRNLCRIQVGGCACRQWLHGQAKQGGGFPLFGEHLMNHQSLHKGCCNVRVIITVAVKSYTFRLTENTSVHKP